MFREVANIRDVVKYIVLISFLLMSYCCLSQNSESIDYSKLSKTLHHDFADDFGFCILIEIDEFSVFSECFLSLFQSLIEGQIKNVYITLYILH